VVYKQPISFIVAFVPGFESSESIPSRNRVSVGPRVSAWIAAAGLICFASSAFGGEKIQITEGTEKVELPGRVLKEDLFSKPLDFRNLKGSEGGGSLIPALPAPILPTNLRKDQFEKKNWLLNAPGTPDQSETLRQILGVRDYDSDGAGKKSKTTRSFEGLWEKSAADRMKTSSNRTLDDPQARKELGRGRSEGPADPLSRISDGNRANRSDSSSDEGGSAANGPIEELNFNDLLRPTRSLDPLSRESAANARTKAGLGGLGQTFNQGSFGQATRSREQELRAQEFEKLLKGPLPFSKRPNDPINSLQDSTRQEINPVRGQRLENYQGSTGSALATDSLPGLGKASRPGLFDSLNTKVLGASSLAPAVMTPAPPPIGQPKPPVLEIPKRRF